MTKSKSYSWILLICLLVITLIIVIRTGDKVKGQAKATWEYKVIALNPPVSEERTLNQLGSEGWELVQMIRNDVTSPTGGIYILKRAK